MMVVPPGWWTNIWYRRPQWRDIHDYTRQLNDESLPAMSRRRSKSPSQVSTPIPNRLALDRVLDNKTCNPLSLHDFYLYMKYIEHSCENLEFYLWYKNYDAHYPEARREKEISKADYQGVQPPPRAHSEGGADADASSIAEIIQNKESFSSLEDHIAKLEPPCVVAAKAPSIWGSMLSRWSFVRHEPSCTNGVCRLDELDDNLDIESQGSAVPLPLFAKFTNGRHENRAELDAAIATFLVPGAEKELNISHALRQRALQALEKSSDPRHLKPVADHIYEVMKNCSHRNFVSVGVSTGTYETVCVGNILGVLHILAGLVLVFVQGFHPYMGSHSRNNALYALPLWAMGVTLLLVGTQGMCFVMLSMAKRQALPWERFEDDASVVTAGTAAIPSGPKGWFKRYRRFMNRTVAHDRKFKIEDRHLRRLQIMILLQCVGGGILAGLLGVVLFIFLPIWKETI